MRRQGRLFVFSFFAILWISLSSADSAFALGKKKTPAPPHTPPPVEAPETHGEVSLRVLSYNVQGLPLGLGGDNDRFMDIGILLRERRNQGTAPHIVALQEAFVGDTDDIARFSGYPYMVRGPGTEGGKLTNSGLVILSEFPITSHAMMIYSRCYFTDCYATKGAHHVRVEIPGLPHPLDLFNTHMNADPDFFLASREAAIDVRMTQARELFEFQRQAARPKAPVLSIGDFNFHPADRDYDSWIVRTTHDNSAEFCGRNQSCAGDRDVFSDWQTSYDHQFYEPGAYVQIEPLLYVRNFREKVRGRDLSDHPGLEVHYRLSW